MAASLESQETAQQLQPTVEMTLRVSQLLPQVPSEASLG